jgi:hypothetical protein
VNDETSGAGSGSARAAIIVVDRPAVRAELGRTATADHTEQPYSNELTQRTVIGHIFPYRLIGHI